MVGRTRALGNKLEKIARPWPRACRIVSNMFSTLILDMFLIFVGTFAMEANSNTILEHFCWKRSKENQFEQDVELELLFLV